MSELFRNDSKKESDFKDDASTEDKLRDEESIVISYDVDLGNIDTVNQREGTIVIPKVDIEQIERDTIENILNKPNDDATWDDITLLYNIHRNKRERKKKIKEERWRKIKEEPIDYYVPFDGSDSFDWDE